MLAAADLFGQAAATMPEITGRRSARADLLAQAVSAYLAAYALFPVDATPLARGLSLARTHQAGLVEAYALRATTLPEYSAIDGYIERFQAQLAAHTELEPPPPPPDAPATPTSPTSPTLVVAPERPAPAPAGTEATTRAASPPRESIRRVHRLRVGFGVSAGLAAASLAGALGAAGELARTPFRGRYYRDIVAATRAAGFPQTVDDDMCRRGAPTTTQLSAACAARDRGVQVAVAMTVTAAVMLAASIVVGALLVRARTRPATLLRRRSASVGITPSRGGALVSLGARF